MRILLHQWESYRTLDRFSPEHQCAPARISSRRTAGLMLEKENVTTVTSSEWVSATWLDLRMRKRHPFLQASTPAKLDPLFTRGIFKPPWKKLNWK
jgi:hypothetical protein